MKQTLSCIALLVFGFVISGCQASRTLTGSSDNQYMFALIGDMPYGVDGVDKFDNLVEDINEDNRVEWVLHAGDIKTGGTSCSDDFLKARHALFLDFQKPFIFTPGDNEWTDCYRESAGGFDPLERLEALRSLFYPDNNRPLENSKTFKALTQASDEQYALYPENLLWDKGGVVFASLHIVGSQNGMAPFAGRTTAHDEEAKNRLNAAIAWMNTSFERATRMNSAGVFLMIHANPQFGTSQTAFVPFLDVLEEHVIRFGKPVLLAHGDSHYFRIDKPLVSSVTGKRIENFTRVETFGAGDIHWLRISVDPGDPNVFSIRQELVIENYEKHSVPEE